VHIQVAGKGFEIGTWGALVVNGGGQTRLGGAWWAKKKMLGSDMDRCTTVEKIAKKRGGTETC